MSNLKKAINFKALENELDDALRADELYKLQNDAKFRAIEQRVPTYDHFADMVKAAHLKPLERAEMQKKAEVSWNHCYKCREDEALLRNYEDDDESSDDVCTIIQKPKTSAEFLREWTRLNDPEDKFEFLLQFRDSLKDKFFKTEIPTDFLEQFFEVASEICSTESALLIIYFLQMFAECNRFSLSLTMITNRQHSQLLFDNLLRLIHNGVNVEAIKNLACTYGVILKAELYEKKNEVK